MYDVITVGAATRDLFFLQNKLPTGQKEHQACLMLGEKIGVDSFVSTTGGGASNSATTFARLGWSTAILSCVGQDDAADTVEHELIENGVDVRFLARHRTLPTAHSTILTDSTGERTIFTYRGASKDIPLSQPWKEMRTRWFYITSLGGNKRLLSTLFQHAAKHGIRIAWNPGTDELEWSWRTLSPFVKRVHLLFLNNHEAAWMSKETDPELMLQFFQDLPPCSVITCGDRGSYAVHNGEILKANIYPIRAVSTTGAGDAFGSGFVVGYDIDDDPVVGLEVGSLNSQSVVRYVGAKTGILRTFPSVHARQQIRIRSLKHSS